MLHVFNHVTITRQRGHHPEPTNPAWSDKQTHPRTSAHHAGATGLLAHSDQITCDSEGQLYFF